MSLLQSSCDNNIVFAFAIEFSEALIFMDYLYSVKAYQWWAIINKNIKYTSYFKASTLFLM
jgi:hypothetical protein